MTVVSAEQVRALVVSRLENSILAAGRELDDLPDDLDLLTEGIIDSVDIVELISTVEQTFGIVIDFSELDPEQLTVLGSFCRYIADRSQTPTDNKHPDQP
ncbi:MAG: acyl carrier protein [Candidatus Binataceae bacterium]|nr:acyl carrier protein [Candidatus Binataceae bacterium]